MAEPGQVHVIARVGEHAVALSSARLVRLSLLTDVRSTRGLVWADDTTYAAWSLGALLGIADRPQAVVLLRQPLGVGSVPIALGVGRCLAVVPTLELHPLSGGLRGARHACTHVFRAPDPFLVGWSVDLAHLWTREELEESLGRCQKGQVASPASMGRGRAGGG